MVDIIFVVIAEKENTYIQRPTTNHTSSSDCHPDKQL
jgi:hypothetical protein